MTKHFLSVVHNLPKGYCLKFYKDVGPPEMLRLVRVASVVPSEKENEKVLLVPGGAILKADYCDTWFFEGVVTVVEDPKGKADLTIEAVYLFASKSIPERFSKA